MKFWGLLFYLLCCNNLGFANGFSTEDNLSGVWSLRTLARASNAVLVIVDDSLEKKPQFMCNLKDQEVPRLSPNLKMIIDEKVRGLTEKQIDNMLLDGKKCEIECTCDIYVLVIQAFPENQKMQKSLSEIQKKAKITSSADRRRCAKNFKDFCHTRLVRIIRSEIRQ